MLYFVILLIFNLIPFKFIFLSGASALASSALAEIRGEVKEAIGSALKDAEG